MEKQCKKAWIKFKKKIEGKIYEVEGIKGYQKCSKFSNCSKIEAIAIRAAIRAIK